MSHPKCPATDAVKEEVSDEESQRTRKKTVDEVHENKWKSWIIGSLFILTSLGMLLFSPTKIYVRHKLTLKENGESMALWMEPNIDAIFRIYVFNITNENAFLNGKEKLHLQEVGPYVYRLKYNFKNPVFNNDEGTVTVTPTFSLEWVQHLNTRNENETLVLANIPMLTAASTLSSRMDVFKMASNGILRQMDAKPITEQKVRLFLFGEENPLLATLSRFLPNIFKSGKFGVIDMAIAAADTTMTFYTGVKNFQQAGILVKVSDESHLPQWQSSCGNLEDSTDGKKFGNQVKPGKLMHVYQRTLCRQIPLIPAGPSMISTQGIPYTPYAFSDDFIDNGQKNKKTKCYCKNDKCLPFGMIDASECYWGFPGAFSYPHFYKGDPILLTNIEGLKPNKTRHESKIFINLETGTAISITLRMQSNLVLNDINDIHSCAQFSNQTIPIIWFDGGFNEIESKIAFKFFLALRIFPWVEKGLAALGISIGTYFIFRVLLINKTKYRNHILRSTKFIPAKITKNSQKKQILPNEDGEVYLQTLLRNNNNEYVQD